MKRIKIILAMMIFLSSFTLEAKHKDSPVKDLFIQVEDNPNLSSIYVTKKMVELRLRQETSGENKLEFKSLIDNFHELIMIASEDGVLIPAEKILALRKTINENGYEQIARMSENGESLSAYLLEDENTDRILDLIVIATEKNEQMIISASGNLTMADLGLLSKLFNINIMGMLNL